MRTTLTLDDDVARDLQEQVRRRGDSFKAVVNDTLRAGLQRGRKPAPRLPPFRVEPTSSPFRSGVDLLGLNRLNDELEIERLVLEPAGKDSR